MTNRVIPSIEREIDDRRPGDGALFIKVNLADVVAPFDNDNKDAAFGGEVAGDLNEEPTVVVVIEVGVEAGGCEVRDSVAVEAVAVVHPIAIITVIVVVLVIAIAVILDLAIVAITVFAISVVLVHAIAVVVVYAVVIIPILAIAVVLVIAIAVVSVHPLVVVPILAIAVVPVVAIVIVLAVIVVVVIPIVVIPVVLVLAISIDLLLMAPVIVGHSRSCDHHRGCGSRRGGCSHPCGRHPHFCDGCHRGYRCWATRPRTRHCYCGCCPQGAIQSHCPCPSPAR
jgi:hypothetical protein